MYIPQISIGTVSHPHLNGITMKPRNCTHYLVSLLQDSGTNRTILFKVKNETSAQRDSARVKKKKRESLQKSQNHYRDDMYNMYILASRALASLVESKHSVLCYGRIKDVLSHLNPYRWVTSDEYTDRRKFRSQTSDNMDRWKVEQGRGREKRKIRRKKSKKKEDADAWKGRKVAKHCVFPMVWGSGGSKSRLAKAAGAEPAGQMRDEKLHAVVARSTFAIQNVQSTWCSEHFWQLRCRKSARRCGAKHISKSKCTKH